MRTLVIDTATEACSIALIEDGKAIAADHRVLGRGHAERLIPMIANLPQNGRCAAILVGLGPGSFTGVRIGIAAARALGIAWKVPVRGFPTLALIAAIARNSGNEAVDVVTNGGHGQWFVQHFDRSAVADGPAVSLAPEQAIEACRATHVAGSRAEELVACRGWGTASSLLPDASGAMALPEWALSEELSPLYGRGPDASLPQ